MDDPQMGVVASDLTAGVIFDRYERVRSRFPVESAIPQGNKNAGKNTSKLKSLTEIQPSTSAFVFDAFGVLNVGETLIPGADKRVDELRAMGSQIRILTNAAGYPRSGAIEKFKKLGISLLDDEIITSRDATLLHLAAHFEPDFGPWGCIAAPEDDLSDITPDIIRLGDAVSDYDKAEGFLFLSGSGWTQRRQDALQQTLAGRMRPVLVANADLVAPRDGGFSLEPGWFGHQLVDAGATGVRFFGKPFPEVYGLTEQSLRNTPASEILMCGDTLHTDILGAAARGWQTAFITQDGLFAGHATEGFCERSGLHPDWQLARI